MDIKTVVKPAVNQLYKWSEPGYYAGEPTGKTVYKVMTHPDAEILSNGVMGRGDSEEAAIKDFFYRWAIQYNTKEA